MRNAARQQAQAFQPLRLAKLVLHTMPLGCVHADPGHPGRFSSLVADHVASPFKPLDAAVRTQGAVLHLVDLAACEGTLNGIEHRLPVIRVYAVEEAVERPAKAPRRLAMNPFERVRPPNLSPPDVPVPGAYVGGLQAGLKA